MLNMGKSKQKTFILNCSDDLGVDARPLFALGLGRGQAAWGSKFTLNMAITLVWLKGPTFSLLHHLS